MDEHIAEDQDTVDEEIEFDGDFEGPLLVEPPHPINWNLLGPEDLEAEWLELNRWVHWLRRTYGLPAAVIPPFWHHHTELLWELSALHLHWLWVASNSVVYGSGGRVAVDVATVTA